MGEEPFQMPHQSYGIVFQQISGYEILFLVLSAS